MLRYAQSLLALSLLPLAACGGPGTSISINASSDEGDNAVISTDANGQMAIKADGFEGSFKLPAIKINAEDFDVNGVKLYPKSTIGAFNLDAQEKAGEPDEGKLRVTFASPAAAATVQAWFRDNMTRRGFKVETAGQGLKGTTDDGEPFVLTLSDDGDQKSKGTLAVGS
ncbi:hypothetical protein [Sphingomonas sp. M1-B02]|uniref:hypothetical protein n=1 Tax=Sphingomonas sp. M1-B02 TaxID=3114300 RepID=UPI00224071E6|nr:hypothetical protein [Sphingomonas sp. S6-11]UZK65603.1 hypothetical protein OKW87_13950 [Sphingomonas sp. S6-11]